MTSPTSVESPKLDNRRHAARFSIAVPVQFRPLGAPAWLEGTSINVSGTGIMFSSASCLEPGTRVEVIFPLSKTARQASVQCRGAIVRVLPRAMDSPATEMVAAIECYRLAREPQPPLLA